MTSFNPLQSVTRTMDVLELLNRRAFSRVQDLAAETGLPTATVVRILETLVQLGYVEKEGWRIGYRLTDRVLSLSRGYAGLPSYYETAREALTALTREQGWPSALATLEDTAMVVRFSTIPDANLSHARSTLNKRLDLLTRAHGRAYLAYCSEDERMGLYKGICETEISRFSAVELAEKMEPILVQVRHLGYAERSHDIDPQTSTLALPILRHGGPDATIGITFFKGARPNRKALARRLRDVAEEISGS